MGKKRRSTAKTGDVALYKSRGNDNKEKGGVVDNDNMYNEVERFHNQKEEEEYLRFNEEEEEHNDLEQQTEGVMDLGVTYDDSSSSDDSDSDDSSNHNDDDGEEESSSQEQEQEVELSDDDYSSLQDMEKDNVLDWGSSKNAYYHGDTADLEIGQDEEDAMVEEEAAKQVLKTRYADMEEEDFLFTTTSSTKEDSSDKHKEKTVVKSTTKKQPTSKQKKRRQLQSHHPELLPLVKHFSEVVKEYNEETRVVANALLFDNNSEEKKDTVEAIGATPMGLRYLATKSALQASVALNVATYLLLKSEQQQEEEEADTFQVDSCTGSIIQSHPVLARLQQYNAMMQKLGDRVENDSLSLQLSNLVKATALMKEEEGDEEKDGNDGKEEESTASSVGKGNHVIKSTSMEVEEKEDQHAAVSSSSEESDEEEAALGVLNEARFGLRPVEVGVVNKKKKKRQPLSVADVDFGEDDDDDAANAAKASRALARTMNTMEQKSQTRKRRAAPLQEEEGIDEVEEWLGRGLAMMEEQGLFDGSDNEEGDGGIDNELSDNDDNDFYNQIKKKSKSKRDARKNLYRVAPKFPTQQTEVEGERGISRAIFRNRGLVAHKSKLNRNPRVKKREQYRKALIRRKGTVREVRTGESHKYGGEETGIKSGLSRSRKLGTR